MVGMRKQEEVFLKGKVKHCRHIQPDTGFEPHKWSVNFYPDEESLNKIKELKKEGVQNHLKNDDDGWWMKFSRPTERVFKGVKEGLAPPRVIDKNGVPIEVRIGDGSDGVISLEVYQHKTPQPGIFKKAARWRGLRVDNLIQFNAETDYSEAEKAEIKTLREEPEQLF